MAKIHVRENFQQARWDEPIIYDLSTPGLRGIIPAEPDDDIIADVGDVAAQIPDVLRRKDPPALPEVDQKHVLSHWVHLSQETMGSNVSNDISEGTCTMKYNPRINEALAMEPKFTQLHPEQPEETVQGILKIYHEFEKVLLQVSGMDKFTLQPGGGNQAVYTAASIVRAYFEDKGELNQRNEVITTIFSHPCDAAAPATAGFKIITIHPDRRGIPDLEAIRAAASKHTAAIFMTNPEDIGIYNPHAKEITKIIHDVGGLCFYDQANANAFLGIARAREAGFDMCHFNVHKTFGTPHGGSGPACGALGVRDHLSKYLPPDTVGFNGERYFLERETPESIGYVREYAGSSGVMLKAYAWSAMMGAYWLKKCAEVSVINNNYMFKLMGDIPGISSAFEGNGITRMEQIRYSFKELKERYDIGSEDMNRRMLDRGIPWFWSSHHPWVIPEPMTLEPCEAYTKEDIEEYVEVVRRTAAEAADDPDLVKNSPYNSAIHKRIEEEKFDDPAAWALTWKAYLRKRA